MISASLFLSFLPGVAAEEGEMGELELGMGWDLRSSMFLIPLCVSGDIPLFFAPLPPYLLLLLHFSWKLQPHPQEITSTGHDDRLFHFESRRQVCQLVMAAVREWMFRNEATFSCILWFLGEY